MPARFALPASRLDAAQTLVARFARKAAKLRMPAPELAVTRSYTLYWLESRDGIQVGESTETRPAKLPGTRVRALAMVDVEVTGERPVLAGWSFAAVIQATPAGNILRKSPMFEADLPERFRSCTSECDHCKKVRSRSETFVVVSTSGEFRQVGRSCLGDFTAAADPNAWLASYQFELALHEFIGEGDGLGGFDLSARALFADDFLEMVAAHVREFGYLGAKQAAERNEASLGAMVLSTGREVLFGATDRDPAVAARYSDAVTDEDRKLAADAIAWVTSDAVGHVSDYVHNVRMYLARDIVDTSSANVLASLVQSYRKHLGMRVEKASKANEHLPGVAVKQRLRDLALTLVVEHAFDTAFGTKWILRFEDEAGRCVVWKTTSRGLGYSTGDRVVVTGTVKELGEYQGTKQTELTRCVVEKVDTACAA